MTTGLQDTVHGDPCADARAARDEARRRLTECERDKWRVDALVTEIERKNSGIGDLLEEVKKLLLNGGPPSSSSAERSDV